MNPDNLFGILGTILGVLFFFGAIGGGIYFVMNMRKGEPINLPLRGMFRLYIYILLLVSLILLSSGLGHLVRFGLASGLALGTLGFTHCCIEDIGVLRSIPGITIISPADSLETVKALYASVKHKGPCYIRLTGASNNPIVYEKDYDFKIGKSIKLRKGNDVAIFCSGASVFQSLKAAEILESRKISCSVTNMHTIKPLDQDAVKNALEAKLIVSVEEHNVIGGLGSAISEFKSSLKKSPKQIFIGVNDFYSKGGTYNFLLKKHGLTSEKIVENIILSLDQ